METWIDFAVIAGNPTKIQEHSANEQNTEKQENSDRAAQCCSSLGMIENSQKAGEAPEGRETDWYSPEQ